MTRLKNLFRTPKYFLRISLGLDALVILPLIVALIHNIVFRFSWHFLVFLGYMLLINLTIGSVLSILIFIISFVSYVKHGGKSYVKHRGKSYIEYKGKSYIGYKGKFVHVVLSLIYCLRLIIYFALLHFLALVLLASP